MRSSIRQDPRDRLERALRIPASSGGWRGSFETSLDKRRSGVDERQCRPVVRALPGRRHGQAFGPLRVMDRRRESQSVTSLMLEPTDGRPLVAAVRGQFIVLRLRAHA